MLYEYPPIYWYSPDSVVWLTLIRSFWLVSAAITLAGIIYFQRALSGTPCAKWMSFAWLIALLLEISFMIPIGSIIGLDSPLAIGYVPALAISLASLFHCLIALESGNVRAKQQAARIAESVIAMGVMVALVMLVWPAQASPRETGPRSRCKNNLKQVGLAFHNWADAHDGRFADAIVRDDGKPPHSWRVELLPYVDETLLFNDYDQSQTWDSVANIEIAKREIRFYQCPSLPNDLRHDNQGHFYTSYATVIGNSTLFPRGNGIRWNEVGDGLTHTALVVEACGQQIIWSEPRDIEKTAANVGVNLPANQPNQSPAVWSSFHQSNGANLLMADGSVRWLSKDTDPQVLNALLTRDGGEDVANF